jgi:hypothetical protein
VLYRIASGQEVHLLGDEAKEALKLREEDTNAEARK